MRRFNNARRGQLDVSEGTPQQCVIGQAKICFPLRGPTKMDIVRIVNDIEVDDETKVPFKKMRYPIEDGQQHQNLIAKREAWFRKTFNFEPEQAAEWTQAEFTAFFGTQPDLVEQADPGDTIRKLEELGVESNLLAKAKQETKSFFVMAEKGLILLTPMKTYPKSRYFPGVDTKLLYDKEWPDSVSYWTANSIHLSNIITQVNLSGVYSPEEELREVIAEKAQLKVATEFGQEANIARSEHNQGYLDFLQQRLGRFEGDKAPTRDFSKRPVRPLRWRGQNSTSSGSSSSASTTAISEPPPPRTKVVETELLVSLNTLNIKRAQSRKIYI